MFHRNLRNAREELNLSQKKFAEILNIPVTTYRNYENTLREPSFEILIKISETLKISVDELLGVKNDDAKYYRLFAKIKKLNDNKLYIANAFVDFLLQFNGNSATLGNTDMEHKTTTRNN